MEPIVIFHKDHQLDPSGVNAGAETATILLAKAFAKLGIDVVVAAQLPVGFCVPGSLNTGVVVDGVTYLDLTSSFDIEKVVNEIERQLQFTKYHLIVASRAQALLQLRNNPRILSKIFISHEPTSGAFGVQAKVLPQVADRIVSVSEAQKRLIVDAGCPADAITVVPNGADTEVFAAGDIEQRDYQRIAFAGALVIDKGVHLLIEAFSRLVHKYPNLKLDIYGSARMWGRENYFDIEAAKQVKGLTFHGEVSQAEISKAFQEAGVLALPSLWFDSFPLTAVEAQVTGLPVLGSANGGMKEIIQDGVTGVLLKEINTDAIADQLERMISNPDRLRAMSQQALLRLRPKYTWENTAKEILKLTANVNASGQKKVQTLGGLKVGLLSTWNQECGLATYGRYIASQFNTSEIVILAEDVDSKDRTAEDERNVRRCWKRLDNNYDRLWRAIEGEEIQVLHLNCHYRFFNGPVFAKFLENCREKGVYVIAHIHNPYTLDSSLQSLVTNSSAVVVHTEENRLEVIANGAAPENVFVVEHGVRRVEGVSQEQARRALGISNSERVAVCFGFVQVHKGIDQVIDAVSQLSQKHSELKLYIVGGPHEEDSTSQRYYGALKEHVVTHNLQSRVHFVDGFVPEETVDNYLIAADVVLMNYHSQHYEASGAVCRALGCGAAIITSIAPPFARLGSAVMHCTTGYPLVLAMHIILSDEVLRETLKRNARSWAIKHSWENTAQILRQIYEQGRTNSKNNTKQENFQVNETPVEARSVTMDTKSDKFKILMQNRHTALSHPGGDTVVMERVADALRALGADVEFDLTGEKDVTNYDIVHIHNFATPEVTERFARNCNNNNVPYVVTTMYEDLPVFYNQMLACFHACATYVDSGQPRERWAELVNQVRHCQPSTKWDNTWTAEHAGALISTGKREQGNLRRDYPNAHSVEIYHLGCDITEQGDGGELFRSETGLSDFILCVGRLETRKNQLMLLKALEDSDLPLVFATGGFTYQKEYEDYCRKFKRKGPTYFLGRMDKPMLASAFGAAKVHALPSWYELPGIVSLEAARYGTNIVVADLGTERDYFGEHAFYCKPDDAESIHNAVVAAFYSPTNVKLRTHAERYTWANAARDVLTVYSKVVDIKNLSKHSKGSANSIEVGGSMKNVAISAANIIPGRVAEATQSVSKLTADASSSSDANYSKLALLCDEGDELVREGKLKEAMNIFAKVTETAPEYPRAYRSCGVVALNQSNFAFAEECFKKALELAPNDCKSLTGVGACKAARGEQLEAIEYFVKSLDRDPTQANTLSYLLSASYAIGQFDRLQESLERFTRLKPEDTNMNYCLAGCYYKQGKLEQALSVVEKMLKAFPTHAGARELLEMLSAKGVGKQTAAPVAPAVHTELVQKNGAIGQSMTLRNNANANTAFSQAFNSPIQAKLTFLEELKKEQKYELLLKEVDETINSSAANADQKAHALILKGEASACIRDFATAELSFKQAESNAAFGYRALVGQGAVLANAGNWAAAEQLFNQALASKESDNALAGLAMCAIEKGDSNAGWDFYRRAFIVNPENIKALCGLVQLAYKLNRLDELEKALLTYLDIHPANLSMLYAYAGCLYAQNKNDESVAQLGKIMLFDPNHALAVELLEKIQSEIQDKPSVNF